MCELYNILSVILRPILRFSTVLPAYNGLMGTTLRLIGKKQCYESEVDMEDKINAMIYSHEFIYKGHQQRITRVDSIVIKSYNYTSLITYTGESHSLWLN